MRWRYFLLAAAVAALDLASKAWIAYAINIDSGRTIVVIPHFFYLVHTRNPGVVFGMLADAPRRWQAAALVLVSAAVACVIAFILSRQQRWTLGGIALALVLGGAIGNSVDRAVHGAVTDFLDFFIGSYHWHTFNLADSAIVVGAVLLAAETLFVRKGPA